MDVRRPGCLTKEMRHVSEHLNFDTCQAQRHQGHVAGLGSQPYPRSWLGVSIQAGGVTVGRGTTLKAKEHLVREFLLKERCLSGR